MTDGAFRPAPPTPEEATKVQMVVEVLGGQFSEEQALNSLRAHYGDTEKTIMALLDGPDNFNAPPPPSSEMSALREAAAGVVKPVSPPPSRPVIDLTSDADMESEDMKKAMAASLEDIAPVFQPSARAPDPAWAMVRSNDPVSGLSQDEEDMNQAIELSLQDEITVDQFDEKPLEERLRRGDEPVALRASQLTHIYAAMIIHALYFVPQVRRAIAGYLSHTASREDTSMDTEVRVTPPADGPGHLVWSLLETFVYLDLSRMTELSTDTLFEQLPVELWSNPRSGPGDLAFSFYDDIIAFSIESILNADVATSSDTCNTEWKRLFYFRHGSSSREPELGPFHKEMDVPIAKVRVGLHSEANDLVACLDEELKLITLPESQPEVIVFPSEVVAFQLIHYSSSHRPKFSFPSHFYLDQFMYEKIHLANEKRQLKHDLLQKIDELEARKKSLTKFQDRDTLADLRSAAYYYENIAEDDGDEIRRDSLKDTAVKLRNIITHIEEELQEIDKKVSQCRAEADEVFDCPGLQDHKYELRAVLMHDGFYGRNHLYSYVKQRGTWWKTVEHTVSEVSEKEVLEDPTGLHLNAGPFMLIYSRALSPDEENEKTVWPEELKNNVKRDNQAFFETLGPEVVAGIEDPNSPPTNLFALPEDTETSSMEVEPPSRGDDMDLDV